MLQTAHTHFAEWEVEDMKNNVLPAPTVFVYWLNSNTRATSYLEVSQFVPDPSQNTSGTLCKPSKREHKVGLRL